VATAWVEDDDPAHPAWPPLVGRERECDLVLGLLRSGHRLVTLVGLGGVGKTRVAADVYSRHRASSDSPAFLVPLSLVTDADLVVAEIAGVLGVPTLPGGDALDSVLRVLAEDPVLLVLDNFEHVTKAAPAVGRILEQCTRVQILVTSQAPLRLEPERVLEVAPLPTPRADASTAQVRDNPCVQLYCDRAASVHPSFRYGPRNSLAIAELCRRLEGLPLAVELAAARAGSLPASEILARLDGQPLDLLTSSRRDTAPRHVDLRATIDWTVGLLDGDQRRLLRHLAATVVPVDLDTAAAVDDATVEHTANLVAALVDVRLLDLVGEDPARYLMSWSVRLYGREQLRAAGEEDVVLERLVSYQAQRAAQVASGIDDGDAVRWYQAAAEQEPALVHALELAVERGQVAPALQIIAALAPHWTVRGYQPDHVRLVEDALARIPDGGPATPDTVTAVAWGTLLALPHRPFPERPVLAARLRQARDAAVRLDAPWALLRVLAVGCLAAQYTGDFPFAAESAGQALALLDQHDHPRWRARFEVWSGMIASVSGDEQRAIDLGLAALARASRDRDPRTLLTASMMLRNLAVTHPELDDAVPPVDETLELAHTHGYARYEALLRPLAVTEALERGEPGLAVIRCVQALEFALSIGDVQADVDAVLTTVMLLSSIGKHQAAAFFEGTIADTLPTFEARMLPRHRELHRRAVEDVAQAIGPDGLAREMHKGARLTLTDGVRDALGRVRTLEQRLAADASTTPDDLTPRQQEILRLVATGSTNKEIARKLGISPKTVMHHLSSVFQVAGVRTRTEATIWAREHGLVADAAVPRAGVRPPR
jgi:predicted ATPase/DNA-binding CsgD family transcriptional regulator